MQFTKGAHVYDAGQQEIGRISRVVMTPNPKEVTHIVVRRGLIPGEERVIPFESFEKGGSRHAILYDYVADLHSLPALKETIHVQTESASEDITGIPALMSSGWYSSDDTSSPERRYVETTKFNIPDDTIALKEGARIVSEDKLMLGYIDSVVVDSRTGSVTHFVVAQGLLWKTHRLVPEFWCNIIAEDEVHLALDSQSFQALPEYSLAEA